MNINKERVAGLLFYVVVMIIFLGFLFPILWMILSSLKTQLDNTAYPPLFFFKPILDNYVRVYTQGNFLIYMLSSLIVAGGSTCLGLLIGLPAAYSIARYKQGKAALIILLARLLPPIIYLIPWFLFFKQLRLIGTYPAIILTHLTLTLPLVVWVMISFFEDLAPELSDAALIDGCSTFGVFLRIALPISKPGVVSATILAFVFSWNNFLLSLVMGGIRIRTLPVAVFNFLGYTKVDWGGMNAAAVSVTLLALTLTLIIQKHIVKGLTLGGIKG